MSSFLHRLKFYLIGIFFGVILVILFFGKNRCSCSSYLPNGRVLAEIQYKPKKYSKNALFQLKKYHKDSLFIYDSLLIFGEINFDQSQAQLKPCPKYKIYYKNYYLEVEKCSIDVLIYDFGLNN